MNSDLDAARRRIKRQSGAMMAVVVGPFVLIVAVIKVFQQHDYPSGDVRNEPIFWIVVGIGAVMLVGLLVFGSLRELRRVGRRGPRSVGPRLTFGCSLYV